MKRSAYWQDTIEAPNLDALPLPPRADVAIIGAGLTGLSTALAVAKRGVSVVVLEAHNAGWGASSRNGGMVLTGLKLEPTELVAKFGIEIARALDAASIRAIADVERIAGEEQIACDFVRCGHVALASKPSHYQQFQRDAVVVSQHFGREVHLVPPERLAAEIGSSAYHGGYIDDASAGINPAKLVRGLADSVRRAGVAIVEQTPVLAVERGTPSSFYIATPRGDLAVERVVVATGAYTGPESPWLAKRIVPIGSYIIATEPLSDDAARQISPRGRMMFDSKRYLHYFRLTPDRRFLFGGRASFVPESDRALEESAAILRRDMIEVFPQLRDAKIDYAWGGTIDFTADMLPHAGEIDGVFYAAGYAGHGVALSVHLGTQLGQRIAGTANDVDPFMTLPFAGPPLGAHRIPGVVPAVGAWYRLLDAVN